MGWRFRKTFSLGGIRWTATKKGVGYRVAVPSFRWVRFGVSPDGRRYMSLGIPGTGLYWIKYFKPRNQPLRTASTAATPTSGSPPPPAAPPPNSQPWWKQSNLKP